MEMKADLERVTAWLTDASKAVPWEYFMLPVAGQEKPVYRERVYCYELYHQWRCRWGNDFLYSLSGEIDKQGHPIVRCGAKPDFLVHSPGTMTNLLAVEVKPCNAALTKMVKDLKTLTLFRRSLGNGKNYFAAYFWVYGHSMADWRSLAEKLVTRARDEVEIDLKLVQPAIHTQAGEAVHFVAWED